MVTCQLDQEGSSYEVSLVPHSGSESGSESGRGSGLRSAVIGTFEAGLSAFQRHAAVAAELRRHGWMLVAYR